MTVKELIAHLQDMPPDQRVVTEYDSALYPVLGVIRAVIDHYPTYDLVEGEHVVQIEYAEYQ